MKRFICIFLALVTLCALLASCSADKPENKETVPSDTKRELPTADANYDKNGKFILTSSENRKVYPVPGGYVVFCFVGDIVQNIFEVFTFDDKDSAKAYADKCVKEDGLSLSSVSVEDDMVIIAVGFSLEEQGYGSYYLKTRQQVIAEFDSKEEDVEWITQ